MTATADLRSADHARERSLLGGTLLSSIAIPVVLYGLALAVRLLATNLVRFPLTEGSAYYTTVARNLASGRGLEIDAIWSYATPPLVLPRPAFELWQPLASLIAAGPMTIVGATFDSAQLAFALVGALLAPLAWLVARDAARRADLPPPRQQMVALGAGALVAVTGPLVLSVAVPDSTLPFTVIGVAACLAMPAAAQGNGRHIALLGVLLGLAYLTRMEAIWLGLAFVALAFVAAGSTRTALPRVVAVAGVAAACALPWWIRNTLVFGTPLPGQVSDNLFLTRNEQIFGYLERPGLDGFLAQGVSQILSNIANAAWHNLVWVLLVPLGAACVIGMVTIFASLARRESALRPAMHGALGALLVSGAITFTATMLLFPVATLWGTFEHAAGPLMIGLLVAGILGADAFVAAVVRWRHWPRSNAWLAPLTLVALTVPLTGLALIGAARQADNERRALTHVASELPAALDVLGIDDPQTLISDRPIWLADATGRPVIALPDEPADAVLQLAADFGARAIVVIESRGRHPTALRQPEHASCFTEHSLSTSVAPVATVFGIDPECLP